jgi:hypothetical protein
MEQLTAVIVRKTKSLTTEDTEERRVERRGRESAELNFQEWNRTHLRISERP